jgi:hypothetical protein
MSPEGLYLKEDGRRWASAYLVPWAAVFALGGRLRARQLQAERAEKRKTRRK